MEKKDLYLGDEEIENIQYGFRKHRGLREVANCSADYAVKQIEGWLERNSVDIVHNGIKSRAMPRDVWQALKKLVE